MTSIHQNVSVDPFASEEGYAKFRKAEQWAEKVRQQTFHPFPRLPTELKLEILRYIDLFVTASPLRLADLLFAFSDRSFQPSVRDLAQLHLNKVVTYFPFSLYQEVEASWILNQDSLWLDTLHKSFECMVPSCTKDKHPVKKCWERGTAFRWYHYVSVHVDILHTIHAFFLDHHLDKCLDGCALEQYDIFGLLLRLWPYLLTENSAEQIASQVQTSLRRNKRLQYLARLTKQQRTELMQFLEALGTRATVLGLTTYLDFPYSTGFMIDMAWPKKCVDRLRGRIGRRTTISVVGKAFTVSMQQLLLSLPLQCWLALFSDTNRPMSRNLAAIYRPAKESWPRIPRYLPFRSSGGVDSVVLELPSHHPGSTLYDSYGIFIHAAALPDGEVFDLQKWRDMGNARYKCGWGEVEVSFNEKNDLVEMIKVDRWLRIQ